MKLWVISIVLSLLAGTILLMLKDSKSKRLRLTMSFISTVALIWCANVCYQESVDWQFGFYIVLGIIFAACSLCFEEFSYIFTKADKRWYRLFRIFYVLSCCIYIGSIAARNFKAFVIAVPITIIMTGLLYWISISDLKIKTSRKKWVAVILVFDVFMFSSSFALLVLNRSQSAYLIVTIGMLIVMLVDLIRIGYVNSEQKRERNYKIEQIGTYIGQILIAMSMVYFVS